MQYHLVTTQTCNLACNYCGATVEPEIMPVNVEYNLLDLQRFLTEDTDPVIAFYGGEPLANANKVMEIMDHIEAKAFMLQTNGTLMHKLEPQYYSQLHTVLISIDGQPQTTDRMRGQGVQKRAVRGAQKLLAGEFTGDLIARMTVTSSSEIFKDVTYLIEHEQPCFDHVHWQLDVMWDTDYEENREEIRSWLLEEYNPGISRLAEYWIEKMEQDQEIVGIVPFLGIMHSLLKDEPATLRCGAGDDFFSLTTDGRITFCPILPSTSFAVIGDIYQNRPGELPGRIRVDEPCTSCEVREICGGRCLYSNKTKFWGEEGFDLVCQTVKHLIATLKEIQPRVEQLITEGIVEIADFDYPEIPNGVEIIP